MATETSLDYLSTRFSTLNSMSYQLYTALWYLQVVFYWYYVARFMNAIVADDALSRQTVGPLDERAACRCISSCSVRCATRSRIASSRPDDALPAERDLATEFAVSRITVRKAHRWTGRRRPAGAPPGLRQLSSASRVEKNFAKLTSFSEDMRARGRNPRSVWLQALRRHRHSGRSADAALESRHAGLSLSPYSFRGRRADGDRIRDRRWLPACPRSDAVETSLYEALERAGNRPVRALQRLRAVLLTAEQAELLKAKRETPGCSSSGSALCSDGSAVEFSQSYYRGDIYDFVAELSAST